MTGTAIGDGDNLFGRLCTGQRSINSRGGGWLGEFRESGTSRSVSSWLPTTLGADTLRRAGSRYSLVGCLAAVERGTCATSSALREASRVKREF